MSQPRSMDGQPPVTELFAAALESIETGITPGEGAGAAGTDWGHIRWQTGPIQEHGRNGILMEELLEFVVLPRMRAYNRAKLWTYELNGERAGEYFASEHEARAAVGAHAARGIESAAVLEVPNPFQNRESSLSITHIEEALLWQKRRTELRRRQGVEGRNIPHRSES